MQNPEHTNAEQTCTYAGRYVYETSRHVDLDIHAPIDQTLCMYRKSGEDKKNIKREKL